MPKLEPTSGAHLEGGRVPEARMMRRVQAHLGRELRAAYDRLPMTCNPRLTALARGLDAKLGAERTTR